MKEKYFSVEGCTALYNEIQAAIEACNDIADGKKEVDPEVFGALYDLCFACQDYNKAFDLICDDES